MPPSWEKYWIGLAQFECSWTYTSGLNFLFRLEKTGVWVRWVLSWGITRKPKGLVSPWLPNNVPVVPLIVALIGNSISRFCLKNLRGYSKNNTVSVPIMESTHTSFDLLRQSRPIIFLYSWTNSLRFYPSLMGSLGPTYSRPISLPTENVQVGTQL